MVYVYVSRAAQPLREKSPLSSSNSTPCEVCAPTLTPETKLVFHRYGDQYVLREVWTGEGVGRELPESRFEREVLEEAVGEDGLRFDYMTPGAKLSTNTQSKEPHYVCR